MTEPIEKYRCCECGDTHEFEDDAYQCCPPQVTEIFQCGTCGHEYDHYDEADVCCQGGSDETGRPRINPLELEARGQQRLFS